MLARNYSDVRNNFKEICDTVIKDSTAVIVKRKNDEDVVLVSLDEYNNLLENQYLRESSAMHERLLHSIKQAEQGETINMVAEDQEDLLDE